MEITTKALSAFVGGQLRVKDPKSEYPDCGEIKSVRVENGAIKIELRWRAILHPKTNRWTASPHFLQKRVSLSFCSVPREPANILIVSVVRHPGLDEQLIFSQFNDPSNLDPAEVEGLVAKAA